MKEPAGQQSGNRQDLGKTSSGSEQADTLVREAHWRRISRSRTLLQVLELSQPLPLAIFLRTCLAMMIVPSLPLLHTRALSIGFRLLPSHIHITSHHPEWSQTTCDGVAVSSFWMRTCPAHALA